MSKDKPFTDHDCPYCGQPAGSPCKSAGGFIFKTGAHRRRYGAQGYKAPTVELVEVESEADAKAKIAIWFIRKVGGPEHARAILDAAIKLMQVSEATVG